MTSILDVMGNAPKALMPLLIFGAIVMFLLSYVGGPGFTLLGLVLIGVFCCVFAVESGIADRF